MRDCPTCRGTGELRRVQQSGGRQVMTIAPPCPDCGGRGGRSSERSVRPARGGEGRYKRPGALRCPFPAGG
ncbi:hypothetical protein [Methanogenium cariaci]|uniref:hypothetical protein n=1 Tax=Methanogenium cariaci TaxID=2197 RepID=UPI0009F9FB48|nr:hypothetical protein [Methanogenium cariaci]